MRVLVVWEPILATDWRAPSGSTLARVTDLRAKQFWDKNHVISGALSEIVKGGLQAKPPCCVQDGFYWDEAILYPRGAHWGDGVPAELWNGPVVRVISSLEKSLREQP